MQGSRALEVEICWGTGPKTIKHGHKRARAHGLPQSGKQTKLMALMGQKQ